MSYVRDCKLDIEATKKQIAKFTSSEKPYSTLIEKVDCTLGNNHSVTVRLNAEKEVEYIGCSCYTHKEEVEGLILLGTDEKKTCYGFMQAFLKHIRGIAIDGRLFGGYYEIPGYEAYAQSSLHQVAMSSKHVVSRKVEARQTLKDELLIIKNKESVIATGLQRMIIQELGKASKCFRITQPENSIFIMHIVQPKNEYQRNANTFKGTKEIATREKGVWIVDSQWKAYLAEVFNDNICVICGKQGRGNHINTQAHKRTIARKLFIALQASSTFGIQMRRNNVLDKNGKPKKFTYRHQQRQIPGVYILGTQEKYHER